MDVTSFLLAEWFLWFRGVAVAIAGYLLCCRRSWWALPIALLTGYWAYKTISFMAEFQDEVLEQVGVAYMIQAYAALLMPFGSMVLGLTRERKPSAEPDAAPEPPPAAAVLESSETMSTKPESDTPADNGGR